MAQGKQPFRKPPVDGKAKSSLVPLLPLDFVSHLLQAIVSVGTTEGGQMLVRVIRYQGVEGAMKCLKFLLVGLGCEASF